ncbi:zinc finger protein 16 [Trichonephila clavipes]|nr:zinc finger protein 16 [Trichonephila clavipes]
MLLWNLSCIDTNPFENVPEELWPVACKDISNHNSQSTAINCSLPMQNNCLETDVTNANEPLSLLQELSIFQEFQHNSVFEYVELVRENMNIHGNEQEDSVDFSMVRECIKTANDCLLGMNSQHNDLLSENFDSGSEGLILSENPLFNPKFEVPVLQSDHLDATIGRNSENKSEGIKLTGEDFKFYPSNSDLNLHESSLKFYPSNETNHFYLKQ